MHGDAAAFSAVLHIEGSGCPSRGVSCDALTKSSYPGSSRFCDHEGGAGGEGEGGLCGNNGDRHSAAGFAAAAAAADCTAERGKVRKWGR